MIKVYGSMCEQFEPLAQIAYELLQLSGNAAVTVDIINDEQMTELNNRTRKVNSTTDVLSFPAIDSVKPFTAANYPYDYNKAFRAVEIGDIAINLDAAVRQSVEYETGERELNYLFIHALLHILGFDHQTDSQKAAMREMEERILSAPERVGYFAVLGRPNAGKSSLVNAIVGEKVSIVSPKPQTTRDRITGVCTEGNDQLIFVDTPGRFSPRNKLDEYMEKCIRYSQDDVDAVILVLDGTKGFTDADRAYLTERLKAKPNVYVCVNKTDLGSFERIYPILNQLSEFMVADGNRRAIKEVIPTSCKTGDNIDQLKRLLKQECQISPFAFSRDSYTDSSVRYIAGETIREKALLFLQDEVPHGVGVCIVAFDESGEVVNISADIIVEQKSHKPIVIGAGGEKLKQIGTSARHAIEEMLGKKVMLNLFVKVRPDWRDKATTLVELNYKKPR